MAASLAKIPNLTESARALLARVVEEEYYLTSTRGWRIVTPYKYRHESVDWTVDASAAEELARAGCIARLPYDFVEAYEPTELGERTVPEALNRRQEAERARRDYTTKPPAAEAAA